MCYVLFVLYMGLIPDSRFEYQRQALVSKNLQELFLLPHSGHRLNTNKPENLNFIKNSLPFIVFFITLHGFSIETIGRLHTARVY